MAKTRVPDEPGKSESTEGGFTAWFNRLPGYVRGQYDYGYLVQLYDNCKELDNIPTPERKIPKE